MKAAIYCRVSRDREGAGLAVERQEEDCRALAERLGWEVVALYVDNDISAYSGKRRPQYEEMIRAIEQGRIKGILAWHSDRLHRRNAELEQFVSLVERQEVQVQTVASGEINLMTPDGRMFARMLGAAAQREVEHTRDRVRRKKRQAAEQGKYRGGPRPYGFNADGVTIRKKEAEVIRYATKAILAGRSLGSVADELSAKGHKTARGKDWSRKTLREVLVRPRNAGHVGKGRADHYNIEIVCRNAWPGIVSEEEYDAVFRILQDPARRRGTDPTPKWLGAGIYTCGICQSPMISYTYGKGEGRRGYRCGGFGKPGKHMTTVAHATDAYVRGEVAKIVRDSRIVRAMTAGETDVMQADRERRSLLVTRLEQTEADYDEDLIDARRYKAKTERLTAELAEIEERLAEGVQQAQALPIFADVDPGAAFLAAPLDIQRAVLRAVLRVEVQPYTGRRGAVWSKDRLRLTPVG
jgi:DNA invertase Pin-like site-specific DNA recombinase